jgi:hypothetical protein
MRKILIGIISLMAIISSCNSSSKELVRYLEELNININSEERNIIAIIPVNGCHTCIEETIEALNNSADMSKIKVIFPTFDKTQKLKYKKILSSKIEYFEDKKEEVYNLNLLNKTDPVLFFIKNGEIEKRIDYNFSLGKDFLNNEINKFWQN